MGADPFTETDKGETCLHLAAKNAYTECLTEILSASVSIGGSLPVRLADAVLPYTPPVRFIEMRNGETRSYEVAVLPIFAHSSASLPFCVFLLSILQISFCRTDDYHVMVIESVVHTQLCLAHLVLKQYFNCL